MRNIDKDNLKSLLYDFCIPYDLIEKLPASGQREVYISQGIIDERKYIIKVAHYNKYNIGRVQREIQILRQLNSPYFPKIILDTFVAGEILEQYYDNLYTAQEFLNKHHVELQNIFKAEIAAYRDNPINSFYLTVEIFVENIPWNTFSESTNQLQKCEFIKHCFKALELLWENKIVHRDLKPANILIRPDRTPVIIDLGIAKSFNEGTVDLTPTFFQNPHTKRYASPEQLLDKKDNINYKTDQYSMGIIIYNMLTGRFPFGNILEIGPESLVHNMMDFNYIPIEHSGGECCQEFEDFIMKLLKPEPHKRYRTIEKIYEALENIRRALQ